MMYFSVINEYFLNHNWISVIPFYETALCNNSLMKNVSAVRCPNLTSWDTVFFVFLPVTRFCSFSLSAADWLSVLISKDSNACHVLHQYMNAELAFQRREDVCDLFQEQKEVGPAGFQSHHRYAAFSIVIGVSCVKIKSGFRMVIVLRKRSQWRYWKKCVEENMKLPFVISICDHKKIEWYNMDLVHFHLPSLWITAACWCKSESEGSSCQKKGNYTC